MPAGVSGSGSTTPGLWVLGISASHNGSACLMHDGHIVVAVQEERLSGVKRDRTYGARPSLAVRYCLDTAGIDASRLDMVVLSAQGRATEPEHDLALNPQLRLVANRVPWLVISHHLGHAVSAYATSGFTEAAVLVIDGLGSPAEDLSEMERRCAPEVLDGWETLSVYEARGRLLTPVVKDLVAGGRWLDRTGPGMPRFGSLGGMYSAVAAQIFGDPMEAGKVMGLAPYGTATLPPERFVRCRGSAMEYRTEASDACRLDGRWPSHAREYADLAASVQNALEVALRSVLGDVRSRSTAHDLCYAGGVALNCTANEMLWRESGFERAHVPPPAEDSGPAVGAAFHGLWELTRGHATVALRRDGLGRGYGAEEIDAALAAVPGVRVVAETHARDVPAAAAARLSRGQVGGWFVEGAELGPRALGCRSIVADPRSAATRDRINGDVKRREAFRPLAPAVLAECADSWFDSAGDLSPFMLRTWRFRPGRAERVPAVVHVDGTGRVQTVEREQQPRFHALIREFCRLTGVPMVLNTSLNGPGEPVAETPIDALWCLLGLGLDFLVLEDRMIEPATPALDILDLVPVMACDSYSVGFLSSPEDPAAPTGSSVTISVSTPWGPCERPLSPRLVAVVTEVDNTSTGHEIRRRLDTLTATSPPENGDWVRGALLLLARRGVVSLVPRWLSAATIGATSIR